MGSIEHARFKLTKPFEVEIHCPKCFKVFMLAMEGDFKHYSCPTAECGMYFFSEVVVKEYWP